MMSGIDFACSVIHELKARCSSSIVRPTIATPPFEWFYVEGDALWVAMEEGEWNGLEIWHEPAWFVWDAARPFYAFLNRAEHIFIGHASTLEQAKGLAERYYARSRRMCQS